MKVIVWSKENCPQCEESKTLLRTSGIEYEERKIGHDWSREDLLNVVPNARSVPQIFWDEEYIGGLKELQRKIQCTRTQ